MHMQAKGTTDYKSGFTFAFEQLLNVRANKTVLGKGNTGVDNLLELRTKAPACYYTSCQIQLKKLN